ncbi:MAG TPA: beta-N-acetylhexosaminidase [Candidatus Dormibacteraeota bacterium]|nr:beta-N-acetylhexosaminidase [Candidatus Dormibacteraeota bacterium]
MSAPVEELALRCILPGFAGTTAPDWVRRRAAQGLGGVALYARNVEDSDQVRRLSDSLHAERSGLLVAVDEEGGDVTRLEARTGSSYPGNLALGVAGDVFLTEEVAASIGAALARVGVDLDLAPVVDVNSNPQNPVIGVRSFGSDPVAVANQAAAWIRGLQGAGVAACAKHFPGHGDTAVDSHVALPVAGEDPHLGALEPFVAAINEGVRAIMSAHIVVPSIDDRPATISPRVMTGLLRDELGFTGLAVSDGLEMRGLTAPGGLAESAVLALVAGCDLLCVGGGLAEAETVDELVDAIVGAVESGRLTEGRLRQAASRVDALAEWRHRPRPASRERRETGLAAARQAVIADGRVQVGDEAEVVRFEPPASLAAGEVPWGVEASLAARGVKIGVPGKSLVVLVRDLHRHPEQRHQVEALLARRPDAVLVEMGLPLCRPQGARAYITTHGASRASAVAAAEVMRP